MDRSVHWEGVYRSKRHSEVSWYRPHLEISLRMIAEAAPARDARIVDVGGGESTLVDDLVAGGWHNVDVLDLSSTALEVAKARLGDAARSVTWICGDAATWPFETQRYDVWHDRAVFHFLTDAQQRAAYVRQVLRALKPGGFAIVGTFGPQGPQQCSGLPVARYSSDELHDEFGAPFRLLDHSVSVHTTPWGTSQQFVYCYCRLDH